MNADALVLLAVAGAFAAVNGANDGGTLVAIGLKVRAVRPVAAVLLLGTAVGVVPWLLGTRVATTLASRLVPLEGVQGQAAVVAAVVAAVAVAGALAYRGLPTSLTLAVVGGITGGGLGAGLRVSWAVVALVVALAAIAPVAGAVVALLLARLARMAPQGVRAGVLLRRAHVAGYLVLCVAYGANDGQKMLAVFAVASGAAGTVEAHAGFLVASAALFVAGLLAALPRFAATMTGGVLSLRPAHAVGAELSAAATVLGSAVLGAPVSMTQAVSAALVGSGTAESYRKIRWREALRIAAAWVLTLPAAAIVAAALAAAVRTVS